MLKEAVLALVTKPGDSPVFQTPADYGLAFEDVVFASADGVALSGWLIRGAGDKVIVQTHFGVLSSRAGYTPEGKGLMKPWPTKIHYLRHIKALVEAGYSVLAYDMWNHGNSGADPRINVPTLLVQNINDPMCNRDSIDLYFNLLEVEKEMLWVDLEKARLAAYDHFANHPTKMVEFFSRHV